MPAWQMRAHASHIALYACSGDPAVGVHHSSTGIRWFTSAVPSEKRSFAKDRDLAHVLRLVHVTLNFTLLGVVCLHALAALKHHFHDRDTVLTRMLPVSRKKG
jgi:cytochrome b561